MRRDMSKIQMTNFIPSSGKIAVVKVPYIDMKEMFPALAPPREDELLVCRVVKIAKDEEDEINKEFSIDDYVLVDPNTLYKIELGRTELLIGWVDEILGKLEHNEE
jgi:hypothetical protein